MNNEFNKTNGGKTQIQEVLLGVNSLLFYTTRPTMSEECTPLKQALLWLPTFLEILEILENLFNFDSLIFKPRSTPNTLQFQC